MRQEPRAGAPVVHGSEQREATLNSDTGQRPLDGVDLFAPWAGEEERALRVRIHRARDTAQARAGRSKHGRARTVYWLATQFAGDWVFQRAPIGDLAEVIKGLTWLFLYASLIERIEAPDAE